MDNFAAHALYRDVMQPLFDNGVVTAFLPSNTTDRLQPLDFSINKPAKDFLRDKFRCWYAEQVSQGLQGAPEGEVVSVDMRVGVMRELGAQCLVAFYDHVRSHPELIVNGFKEAGIADAIENGEVNLSPQGRSLSHPLVDETDPDIDISD